MLPIFHEIKNCIMMCVTGDSLEVLHFESLTGYNVSYFVLSALEMNSKEVSTEFIVLNFIHEFL